MRTSTVALSLALLLLGVAIAAGASVAAGTPQHGTPGQAAALSEAPASGGAPFTPSSTLVQDDTSGTPNETEPVVIEVHIMEDGDAEFTIRQRFRTATEAERDAFDQVANDFRFDRRDIGVPAFQEAAERTDPTVERDMTTSDPSLDIVTGDEISTVERSFTWTNFANETDDEVVVGDAFVGEDGLWFRTLESNQQLVIQAPEGYRVADSPQGPRVRNAEELIWTGDRTFEPADLQVSFTPEEESNVGNYLLVAAIGLVILVTGGLMLWRETDSSNDERSRDLDELLAGLPWVEEDVDGPGRDPGTPAGGAATEPAEEPVDPELLSDEERVEWLLEDSGGRMKQSNIVSETGWSNAKVSQLLSEMDEDGRLDKLRIGRENLITLPDEDVAEDES